MHVNTSTSLPLASARASDLDVGTRLYTATTRASSAKASRVPVSERESQRLLAQMQNIDVRDEVDRIYSAILAQVDGAATASSGGGDDYFPTAQDYAALAGSRGGGRDGAAMSVISGTTRTSRGIVPGLALSRLRSNTFGSAERDVNRKIVKSADPGPGAYHRDVSSFSSGVGTPRWRAPASGAANKARTRSGTDPHAPVALGPAPGDYAVASTFEDAARARHGGGTFGRATRDRSPRTVAPGPGSYDLEVRRATAAATSAAFRSSSPRLPQERSASPGPTAYRAEDAETRGRVKAPAASFGKASTRRSPLPDDAAAPTPGPGQYNVVAATAIPPRDAKTRGVIPLAGRTAQGGLFAPPDGGDAPGPGNYEPRYVDPHPRSARITGPLEGPRDTRTAFPGPGSYVPHPVVENEPSFTVPKASRFAADEKHAAAMAAQPGPQSYVDAPLDLLSDHAKAPGFAAVLAARFHSDATETPGPGAYTGPAAAPVTVGGVITTAPREPVFPTSQVPGPGTYTLPGAPPVPGAPVFSTAPREPPAADPTPGPGTYFTDATQPTRESPAFGTGPRFEADLPPQSGPTVGPGAYDPARSDFAGVGRGPTFGTHLRDPMAPADTPGPGAYNAPASTLDVPDHAASFTTGPRFVDLNAKSPVPGPGTYEALGPAEHTRAAVFGSEPRAAAEGTSPSPAPGPGTYNIPPSIGVEGASPTFGTGVRPPLSQAPDGPGPGAYAVSTGQIDPRAPRSASALRPNMSRRATTTNPDPALTSHWTPRQSTSARLCSAPNAASTWMTRTPAATCRGRAPTTRTANRCCPTRRWPSSAPLRASTLQPSRPRPACRGLVRTRCRRWGQTHRPPRSAPPRHAPPRSTWTFPGRARTRPATG
jgi:hypothetical protein